VVFWCLVLALHRMPGIHNPRVLSGTLSPAAAEYQLFWNLDKAFAALYLVEFAVRRQAPTREPRFLVAAALALGAAMAVAWIGGLTRLEPKWTSALLWWAPANLLLVALPEETLFRLILQDRLEAWLGGMAGVAVAAILFGLAHFQGGWCYVASATAAGVGYGCAYRYQRNPWHPILTHFGLNALHFLAFVYPKLR